MVTDRILVFNVLTFMSEQDLTEISMESHKGIKDVKRLYRMDEFQVQTPKELLQIEFEAAKYAEPILQEGFIKIENLRCRVKG